MRECASGDIHVWYACPARPPMQLAQLSSALLLGEELARVERFVHESDRRAARLTRVLVRHVLSEMGELAPGAWRFRYTSHGRPVIDNPGFEWLTFNVSHTRSLIVCAVARDAELGVDIEACDRMAPVELARHCFSRAEIADLSHLSGYERSRRFLEYWTLKEAFFKARGCGLSVPLLRAVTFDIGGHVLHAAFSGKLAADSPERWRFRQLDVASDHILAIALAGREAISEIRVVLQPIEALLDRRAAE